MAAPPSLSGSFLMLNPSTNSIGLWNLGSFMSLPRASKVNASPLGGSDSSTMKLPRSPQSQRAKNAPPPPYLVDLMKVFGWTVTSREDDAAVYALPGGSTCCSAASAFERFARDSAKDAKTTLIVRKGPPKSVSQTEVNDSSAFDGERSASRSRERTSLGKSASESAKNEKTSLTEGESPTKNVNQTGVNDSSAFVRERSAPRSRERTSSGKSALDYAKNGKTSLTEGEGPSKNVNQAEVNETFAFDGERSAERSRERTSLRKSALDYSKNGKTSLTDQESPTKNVNQTEVNDSSAFDRERSRQRIRERTSLRNSALDYAKNGKTSLTEGEGQSKNVNQAEVNETFAFDRERSAERSRERTSLWKSAWNYSKNWKTSLTEGENPLKNFNLTEVDDSSAFDRERSGQRHRERTSFGKSALDSAKNGKTSLKEVESPSKKVSQAEVNETSAFDRERSARRSREITSFGKSAWVSAKNGKISLTEGEGPSKNVNQTEVNDSSAFDRETSAQRIRERTSFGKSVLDSANSGKTIVTEGEGPPKNFNQSEVNGFSAFDRERSALSRKRASLTEGEGPSKKVHQKEVDESSSFDRKRSRERISFGKSALDSEKNRKTNVTEGEGPSKRVKQKEVNDSSDFDRERSREIISFRKPTRDSPKNGKTSLTEGEGSSKVNQDVNDSSAFDRERSTERTSFGESAWDSLKTGKTSLTEGDGPSKKVSQMEVNDSFTFDRERISTQRSRERTSLGKSAWDSEKNWKTNLISQEGPWKVNQTEINGFAAFGRERNSLEKFAWDYAKNAKTSLTAQEGPPKKAIQTEVHNSPVFERERSLEEGSEGTLASTSTAVEKSGRKRSWNKVNPLTELNEQSAKKKQKHTKELTLPPNSWTDGDKGADSPPLTLGNNWKSKNLTMQEAPIEEQRRSFKRTERTRRRGSNSAVEPVQGRRKNRINTCSFTGELTLWEKLKDVDYERKMTALSWLIDSGALNENEPLVHKVNARGLATREGILCSCCKKTMSLGEFDCHAGSDRSQPWYNICLPSGKSLVQCHVEAWEKEKKLRSVDFLTVRGGSDPSDDSCGVCAEGGHLICCDNCPSTFHQDCLKLEELPEGKWHCPYCACMFCSVPEGMNNASSLFTCQQCSCKYHWQCTRESRVTEKLAQSLLFCGEDCKEVDGALFNCLARENKIGEGFSWSLLKRLEEHEKVNSEKRLSLTMECNRKLSMVAELFHECFIPMVDFRTGVDLISRAVFNCGSNLKRVDCAGFYTMVLEKDEEIISAATIRFHGRGVAEMPFIGTRPMYSRQGMCRRLFGAIEKLLLTLRVKKLLIPAAPELVGTWVDSFSFNPVEKSDNEEIRNLGLLTFPETILLEKSITVTG